MITLSAKFRILADHVKAACLWAKAHLLFLALLALGFSVPLWLLEHDARLRREFEFQQLRHQAAAEIANLRARAAAALDDADAGAQRVRDLEAQRLQLVRAEAKLRSEISDLKAKERAGLQEIAALPFPRVVERLRSELGPGSFGNRDSQLETRELPAASSQLPDNATDGTRSAGDSKLQIQNSTSQLPENATDGTRSADDSKLQIQNSTSPNPESNVSSLRYLESEGLHRSPKIGPDSRIPNPQSRVPNPASPVPSPGLLLTEPGARAVAAALIERDACREQSLAKDGLLSNCDKQAAASRALMDEMSRSVLSLKEAVRLKDEIESRREAAYRAELKAARGSRLRRFGRALQYVGAGVVIGVVIAH